MNMRGNLTSFKQHYASARQPFNLTASRNLYHASRDKMQQVNKNQEK